MRTITIGVVENEMVIADTICLTLRKLGYDVFPPASNYNKALKLIEESKPDLLLLDINLGGQKDGIDLAYFIRENYSTPIIFLTANSDKATIERAKPVRPNAFLVKPFTKEDLYTAVEIAMSNFSVTEKEEQKNNEALFIKDGYNFTKVLLKEITHILSDHNYVTFHLSTGKKYMQRSTLQEMMQKLPADKFVKVNRGAIINVDAITTIATERVFIDDIEFSCSKASQEDVRRLLNKAKQH